MQGAPHRPGQGNTDLSLLLRRFGVRALALALVAGLLGLTTLVIFLALVGFGLIFGTAPARPWMSA
ncbi:hypothetical protein ACFWX6_00210 [Amycolatopsis sp. NPDC059019]|uniref:hypothetical protein n=2 Tax=unclassified Amycolatopsis TaxID=2618356 RepID=UPI0036711E28